MRYSTCDTLLELDTAINDLSLCISTNEIIAAFPRLSNSCVDNEQGGGDSILLGVQERWTKMLVGSKMLQDLLENKDDGGCIKQNSLGRHSVFEVLRAYLQNFEHIFETKQDNPKALHHCETLLQGKVLLRFWYSSFYDHDVLIFVLSHSC